MVACCLQNIQACTKEELSKACGNIRQQSMGIGKRRDFQHLSDYHVGEYAKVMA